MDVEVRVIRKEESKKWNDIVESSSHGTIFHTMEWLKIMEKHTNSKLYPLIGLNGSTPIGIIPLFYKKMFLTKGVFSPPPKTAVPYLGPIIIDYHHIKQYRKEAIFIGFQKKVDEFIKSELKSHYNLINLPPDLLDSRPFKWTGYQVEPMYNYIFDLSKGVESVWEQLKRNLRQNINRAKRRGITVEEGSEDELEWIYNGIKLRYEEQGLLLPISKEYLLDLYDSLYPKNMKIFVAKFDGEFIGGLVDIYYKDRVISWLGNSKANIKAVSPNDLLQWEAIKYAIEHGLKYYEEIGANTQRLCNYKSKYNPNISLYFSAKKHSSIISKLTEITYFKMLKPMYVKLKMFGVK